MYSIAISPRCFKWKMLSLSGPKALLFLQLLIAFITRSAVNVHGLSNGFPHHYLGTLLKKCVLNGWLSLVASYLDDETELSLNAIASFSASRFALP